MFTIKAQAKNKTTGEITPIPGVIYDIYRNVVAGQPADKCGSVVTGTDGYAVLDPDVLGTYYVVQRNDVTYNGVPYRRTSGIYGIPLTDKYSIVDADFFDALKDSSRGASDENAFWVLPNSAYPDVNAKTRVKVFNLTAV